VPSPAMRPGEYRAALSLLPLELVNRAVRLQRYLLRGVECAACREVGETARLALIAARLDGPHAAERLLSLAERQLTDNDHLEGCRPIPDRPKPATRVRHKHSPGGVHGQVARWAGHRPLVAATDASWKRHSAGYGYLATDGRWGLRGWNSGRSDPSGPSKVLINELRAVELLVATIHDPGTELTLLIDSTSALAFLKRWQRGTVTSMPEGYDLRPRTSGAKPTLVRLAECVARMPGLRLEHVRSHSGHLLNEAADSLASLGRRRASQKLDVRARAQDLVESFLVAWHH
jgi:ribonuclease HI